MAINELSKNLLFRRFSGDTWILPFQVTDSDGAAVTVTGYTAATFALFSAEDNSEVLRLTLDETVTLSTNVITVVVSDTATADLLGAYLFELEIVEAGGYRHTIAQGKCFAVESLIANV